MFRASRIVAAILGLAVYLVPRAYASGRQERDAWQVQSADGKPFGSIHTVVERQPDGSRHYVCKSRSRIDFLSVREELDEDLDCVVTKEFQLVSFSRTKQGLAGRDEVSGTVANGRLRFTLKRQGLTLQRYFPVASQAIPSLCIPDVLAAQDASRDAAELKVIDPGFWTIRTAKARRMPSRDGFQRWNLTFDEGFGSGVWTISPRRDHDQFASKAPAYVVVPSSADQARDLTWHTFSPRECLVFPLDRDLAFPDRLRSLTVRLTWKDVPTSWVQLTDLHQHVVREFDEKGRHIVELRLDHPQLPQTAAPYPLTDKSLAQALSESDFIVPNDAAIRKQALEWTKGSKSALEAVERLSHRVFGYLQEDADLIVETLSGPEVLACRKGKCSEYSTLFASLARSIGVPTRVALGMRLVGSQWMGHMWCEAYWCDHW
jgi:transglutaminase-like putative cysteine protease